jgi:hypothetical protein
MLFIHHSKRQTHGMNIGVTGERTQIALARRRLANAIRLVRHLHVHGARVRLRVHLYVCMCGVGEREKHSVANKQPNEKTSDERENKKLRKRKKTPRTKNLQSKNPSKIIILDGKICNLNLLQHKNLANTKI